MKHISMDYRELTEEKKKQEFERIHRELKQHFDDRKYQGDAILKDIRVETLSMARRAAAYLDDFIELDSFAREHGKPARIRYENAVGRIDRIDELNFDFDHYDAVYSFRVYGESEYSIYYQRNPLHGSDVRITYQCKPCRSIRHQYKALQIMLGFLESHYSEITERIIANGYNLGEAEKDKDGTLDSSCIAL